MRVEFVIFCRTSPQGFFCPLQNPMLVQLDSWNIRLGAAKKMLKSNLIYLLRLIKFQSITHKQDGSVTNVAIDFVSYGTTASRDRSGAYLFLPDGPAQVWLDIICKFRSPTCILRREIGHPHRWILPERKDFLVSYLDQKLLDLLIEKMVKWRHFKFKDSLFWFSTLIKWRFLIDEISVYFGRKGTHSFPNGSVIIKLNLKVMTWIHWEEFECILLFLVK